MENSNKREHVGKVDEPEKEELPQPSPEPSKKKPRVPHEARYALTFGETAILHIGGKELGTGKRESGFSVDELEAIAARVVAAGGSTELYRLSDRLPADLRTPENEAATLVIRDGARLLLNANPEKGAASAKEAAAIGCVETAADRLYLEQRREVEYDTRYFDTRTKKTKNKQARYNVVFGQEDVTANEDFSQYTVCGFSRLPFLDGFRRCLPQWLGPKAEGLNAEGNLYYHDKGGIGFHGDSERKVVVCLSLGRESILRYHWRLPGSSEHSLPGTDISVRHGDVYIMSEKATGHDWRFRSKVRVVHAAGHANYIGKSPPLLSDDVDIADRAKF